ncbi:hypothetical protein [Sphingopyxis sp.]|jgi:hypothetical protein|uniref:hypothetical protein n=1 Tax=Sphingopyxis sp. TaxID=1908224 RepID=UPI0025EE9444|nr:hypothetical protein [Sphingopyxis sp.]MBK6414327.1 hypothetical protein [Sphingopyxis sp.]
MIQRRLSKEPERADTTAASASPRARLRKLLGTLPVRAAIIASKLMIVYILSQADAAFFYQQF